MSSLDVIYPRISEALAKNCFDVSADDLLKFNAVANTLHRAGSLGLGVQGEITIPIVNGNGSFSTTYSIVPFVSYNAAFQITSPVSCDVWDVNAVDTNSGQTLFNGIANANEWINVSYSPGFHISLDLVIQAANATMPAFNGNLVLTFTV